MWMAIFADVGVMVIAVLRCNPRIICEKLIEKAGGQMAKLEEGMEVCESCEVHENLLKIVNEKMPEETELCDLAELFKGIR